MQHVTRKFLVYELTRVQGKVAEVLVPWFTTNMPASYFRQVDMATQQDHLRTLAAHFDPETSTFRKENGRVVLQSVTPGGHIQLTYMDFSGNHTGLLASQLGNLPDNIGNLARIKVFTSLDQQLCFNIYSFSKSSIMDWTPEAASIIDPLWRDAKKEGLKEAVTPSMDTGPRAILDYAAQLEAAHNAGQQLPDGMEWSELFREASLQQFMGQCPSGYVSNSRAKSFLHQRLMFDEVSGTENVAMSTEHSVNDLQGLLDDEGVVADGAEGRPIWWLRVALSNSVPQVALNRILDLLKFRGVDVNRMHLDVLDDGHHGNVTMIRMLVKAPEASGPWWSELEREVKRLKWADDWTLKLAFQSAGTHHEREVGVVRAEILTALNSMTHPILSKQDPWAFSKTNIRQVIEHPRYVRLATGIADLFSARFDPISPVSDTRYNAWLQSLRDEIAADVEELVASTVLNKMVDAVEATLRTNLYLNDRYALSMRFDPRIFRPSSSGLSASPAAWNSLELDAASDFDVPYGVFFVHGRRFNGFHVRFRDISRGGMRLVTPPSVEQLAIESARHFDEAYQLASAQQLKNKDIPEGGSKCVVLIDTMSGAKKSSATTLDAEDRELVVRKSVKAFTDALLDLIVKTDETEERVVDYFGADELLYLGPDEQVIPDDINWIVRRAAERGYPIPSAFMSSKPDAGINHKVYGVTSEGVQVFLDVALHNLDMHPLDSSRSQPVTIKMTGGPDGDVAGNMIKILNREYGDKVSIVALCDHSGSAEDPSGLDIDELLRLVQEEQPIASFDESRLSDQGIVHKVTTDEGLRARNTMHNRVVADAFIPAGGRPATINEDNWRSFLLPNGEPSAKLIVEGANLFVTPGARQLLFNHSKLPIVKDSSANKCGVICSSYEIMSSMLLSESEFSEHKEAIVKDVLQRLRQLARREAELLFAEFNRLPGALPHFSERISNAINSATDAIADALTKDPHHLGDDRRGEELRDLLHQHLPAKLDELAGNRISEQAPAEYVKYAVASSLASRIVYKEGTSIIENHPSSRLAQLSLDYLIAENKVDEVLRAMEEMDWAEYDPTVREQAMRMVRHGGIRAHLASKK